MPPVRRLPGAVALVLLLAAVPASGQEPLSLAATTDTTGYVGLRLHAPPGTQVTITEGPEPVAALTAASADTDLPRAVAWRCDRRARRFVAATPDGRTAAAEDRKSTRLNSSHQIISYAVFCLKKKKNKNSTLSHKNKKKYYLYNY